MNPFAMIETALNERLEIYRDALLRGEYHDISEYRRAVGGYQATLAAIDVVKDVEQKYLQEE